MKQVPNSNLVDRASRVKLLGTVLALIQLENGQHVRARLHQLSTTGGVLSLSNPLDEAIKVEVIFQLGSATVRSRAELLFPMWATKGCLQPFRFTDLEDEDRERLESNLKPFLSGSTAGLPASSDETGQ
ncbi:MAG TPA: hypothetical protein VEV41_15385 [Terriglobales bacterium]|jgi:hypothetical protein|nr:hypothetical protein [Terriglobales bacterium]